LGDLAVSEIVWREFVAGGDIDSLLLQLPGLLKILVGVLAKRFGYFVVALFQVKPGN
jgi:hypothetical protein